MSSMVATGDLAVVSDDALLQRERDIERARNQLAATEYAVLAEIERRGIATAPGV